MRLVINIIKEISSDVINKYQFKKVDDIVNFILEG